MPSQSDTVEEKESFQLWRQEKKTKTKMKQHKNNTDNNDNKVAKWDWTQCLSLTK